MYNGNEVFLRMMVNGCDGLLGWGVMGEMGEVIRVCMVIFRDRRVKRRFVGR